MPSSLAHVRNRHDGFPGSIPSITVSPRIWIGGTRPSTMMGTPLHPMVSPGALTTYAMLSDDPGGPGKHGRLLLRPSVPSVANCGNAA
jgi:hypothetical protein